MRWAANSASASSPVEHLVLLSGISIISRCHALTALGFIISVLPIGGANTVLFNWLSPARRWRLPCLMTLLLHPALSRHSVRHGETLNFCNGLKWSKYPPPPAFVPHSSPVITCCLISWCTDKGRGRFHGEGTLAVFVLLSTWHSVHFTAIILSHSTHSATELKGRTFQLIAFKWK